MAGAALLGLSVTALADPGSTSLALTLTVRRHASLKVLSQPASVTLTAADIARGYLDVPGPAQLAVRSNTAGGFLLLFTTFGDFVREVRVRGLGNEVQLGAAGGAVAHGSTGSGMSSTMLDLGYRFELAASAQQGVYPWPMQVAVQPL